MRLTVIAITIITLICSCKKDKEQTIQEEYLECSQNALADTTLIAGRLAGNWRLAGASCRSYGNKEFIENVRVTFLSNRTYTVKKNGHVVSEGSWHFGEWGGAWSLQTSEISQYFSGAILMCDKILVFSAIPVDGCNYYFRKTL